MSKELENDKTSILVRMKGWQKADLEAAAKKQNRSVNNFVLTELGKRRKWDKRAIELAAYYGMEGLQPTPGEPFGRGPRSDKGS